jgi:hypothetical protein
MTGIEVLITRHAGLALLKLLCSAFQQRDWRSVNDIISFVDRHGNTRLRKEVAKTTANFDLGEIRVRPSVYELSAEETKEFLLRPILMGPAVPLPAKSGRGRRPRKTQYDEAAARRRSTYHKLVRLPENRERARLIRKKAGDPLRRDVENVAALLLAEGMAKTGLASKIAKRMAAMGMGTPSQSRVGEVLIELGLAITRK